MVWHDSIVETGSEGV